MDRDKWVTIGSYSYWYPYSSREKVYRPKETPMDNSIMLVPKKEPAIGFGIYVDGVQIYFTQDKEKADKVLAGVTHLNRYTSMHNVKVERRKDSPQEATGDEYGILWVCNWRVGQMGWDASPQGGTDNQERVISRDRDAKCAYVMAPTALLAIERAKLATTSAASVLRRYEVEGD